MSDSEFAYPFDERRKEFTPYGLTGERRRPSLMQASARPARCSTAGYAAWRGIRDLTAFGG